MAGAVFVHRVRTCHNQGASEHIRGRRGGHMLFLVVLSLLAGMSGESPGGAWGAQPVAATAGRIYYAAPESAASPALAGKSSAAGLSSSKPFRIQDFWQVAEPGDTLLLLDGPAGGRRSCLRSVGIEWAGARKRAAGPVRGVQRRSDSRGDPFRYRGGDEIPIPIGSANSRDLREPMALPSPLWYTCRWNRRHGTEARRLSEVLDPWTWTEWTN